MNLMIASDLHGSAHYCRQLLSAFDREQADRLLLLGDLLYHGPRNDLPEGYDPKAVLALLNERRDRLLCVRGNCDTEVDQMVLQFPMMADYCVLYAADRMVFATHGHHFHLDALPPLRPGDILLHGHTHVPAWTPFGSDNLYLNPGSVSIPQENSPHGYMMLTGSTVQWKDLSGTVYHTLSL
jgi:putative phosphoesterase